MNEIQLASIFVLVESESEDFFNELLFGSGGWLGIILILSVMFLVSAKVKYSGIFFTVIAGMFALQYINMAGTSSDLMWCAILSLISMPFLLLLGFKGNKGL